MSKTETAEPKQKRLGKEFENPKVPKKLREAGEAIRSLRRRRLEMQDQEKIAKDNVVAILQAMYEKDPKQEIFKTGFTVQVDGELALIEPDVVNGISNVKTSKIEDLKE